MTDKHSFSFSYTEPFLDWFRTIDVVIKPDDYCYFRIERRFGPSWWLIGMNSKDEPKYHWENNQIGEMSANNLRRFINWAKNDKGSKIIEFKSISGEFNILEEMMGIMSREEES